MKINMTCPGSGVRFPFDWWWYVQSLYCVLVLKICMVMPPGGPWHDNNYDSAIWWAVQFTDVTLLTKFRLSNQNLPIERGRQWNIEHCEQKGIQCNVLGDEFHYRFICLLFSNSRKLFLSKGYERNINADDYNTLCLIVQKLSKVCKLTKFIKIVMNKLKTWSFESE